MLGAAGVLVAAVGCGAASNNEFGAHRACAQRPGLPLGSDSICSPGAIGSEHRPHVVAYFAEMATWTTLRIPYLCTALAMVVERVIQSRSRVAPSREFSYSHNTFSTSRTTTQPRTRSSSSPATSITVNILFSRA